MGDLSAQPDSAAPGKPGAAPHIVLFLTSDRMGDGPDELGRILMRSFLKTCKELPSPPWRAIFVNSGIALTTEGSPVLDDLHALEERGTEVLSCGTCLDYFQAKEKVRAGRVSTMAEIVQSLTAADQVLRP
jgi:selenium metabolism protein YedF